jgi:RNA polymerase sigma-70 factor (ECF subfamily)
VLSRPRGPEPIVGDDALLFRAIDDPGAFAAFYSRSIEDVLRFFRRRVFDPELCADLTAETYAQLLRSLRSFDPSAGSARQYLFGIARHQLLVWQRRGEVSRRHRNAAGMASLATESLGEDATVERLDAERLRDVLDDALAALTDLERHAVTLRVLERHTYRDIATALGCTEVTARVRVSRGLAKLAVLVERSKGVDRVERTI